MAKCCRCEADTVPKVELPVADLRDYFAAKAMQGLLAQATPEWSYVSHVGLSRDAFAIADAMLAERAK